MLGQAGGETVAGIVAAWGPVGVHADGFRAHSARPHTLLLPPGAKPKTAQGIARLAAAYGAQVLEAGAAELLSHCRNHQLGLETAAVNDLLRDAVQAERRRTRRQRWRHLAACALASAAALGAVVAIIHAWPTISASLRGTPASPPPQSRRLVVLEQHVLENRDGDAVYFAVARNDHPTKTALGVFVAGTLRDRDDVVHARLESRLDTENRPVLAPGDTGSPGLRWGVIPEATGARMGHRQTSGR